MGQPGLGDGDREGTQHCVGQGDLSATTQPAVKRIERCFDTQPAHEAADDGPRYQGDHHMHTGQTEHQHDADRGNYCIHHYNLIARRTIKHRKAENFGQKTAVPVAGSEREYLFGGAHFAAASTACQSTWQRPADAIVRQGSIVVRV